MPTHYEATDELAARLVKAQREHTAKLLTTDFQDSDDGYDYRTSALQLCLDLEGIANDSDMSQLDQLVNRPGYLLDEYACDGIAPLFTELDCAAVHNE